MHKLLYVRQTLSRLDFPSDVELPAMQGRSSSPLALVSMHALSVCTYAYRRNFKMKVPVAPSKHVTVADRLNSGYNFKASPAF